MTNYKFIQTIIIGLIFHTLASCVHKNSDYKVVDESIINKNQVAANNLTFELALNRLKEGIEAIERNNFPKEDKLILRERFINEFDSCYNNLPLKQRDSIGIEFQKKWCKLKSNKTQNEDIIRFTKLILMKR